MTAIVLVCLILILMILFLLQRHIRQLTRSQRAAFSDTGADRIYQYALRVSGIDGRREAAHVALELSGLPGVRAEADAASGTLFFQLDHPADEAWLLEAVRRAGCIPLGQLTETT